jgi:hypothetical protein
MWKANPTWGSPRIVGELKKLGIDIAKSTVEKYRPKPRKPSSPTWRTFLKQHMRDTVAIDFFTVPTVRFRVLFVLVVLVHDRRRVIYFNVTEHPTAEWTAQQLVEAFPDVCPEMVLLGDIVVVAVHGHVCDGELGQGSSHTGPQAIATAASCMRSNGSVT